MERTRPDASDVKGAGEAEAEAVTVQVQVKGQATCPLCLDPLTTLPRLEVCAGCRTIHHTSCVDEFGRCGTPACQGLTRATAARPRTSAEEHENERGIAAASHVASLFGGGPIVPLAMWFLTRDRQPYAAHHAWRAFLFSLASIPLTLITLGLWVPVMMILMVRAAVRTWRGDWIPYGRGSDRRGPASEPAPPARDASDASAVKAAKA